MSNVLVVSALPEETEYIADYVKGKPQWEQLGEDHFRNVEKDVNIRVKVLGVGKVNAAFGTADGIHEANPDLIVNIGVAGGLADDLDRGSVAIGTDYVQVDLHTLLPENEPEMHVASTFRDVSDLLDEFHKRGIDEAEFCLVGWNKSGHDGRWPQAFPVEEKLGGEEELRKLTEKAKRMGFRRVILQTRPIMPDAVALYVKRGYRQIPNYPPYDRLAGAVCFAKAL